MTRARRHSMPSIEFHPISMLFPLIEGEAFDELVTDIKAHGLHEPIVMFEGKVRDGRNRYRACAEADIEPEFATNPLLKQAIAAIDAWGFTYQSNVAWDKEVIGLGWWLRSQHELLLIATRGDMPHPPAHARPPSVIRERRRESHRKPDRAYELIEQMYPELPKVELFLRGKPRPGWSGWGNQAEAKTEPPRRMTIAELEALAPHEK